MNNNFKGWSETSKCLSRFSESEDFELNDGQRASLRAIAERIPTNGVIIADEVGMGKTRIAVCVAKSVVAGGGRVAILVPPGLGFQWGDELRTVRLEAPLILRSLWQFLQAWSTKEYQNPWFDEKVVVISHAFTNWRLGKKSDEWRWALLPELYARWRKKLHGRWPRGYYNNDKLNDEWVQYAAASIIDSISNSSQDFQTRKIIQDLIDKTPWPGALNAGEYERGAELRLWLERSVGLGLGVYDLVIIDEAHKSRGHNSGLNRLLNNVVLQSSESRRLAMTATPVEIDAEQWKQVLSRIKVDAGLVSEVITTYAESVHRVRNCPNDLKMRENFKDAALKFQEALSPFLLRRDKGEDRCVRKFNKYSGEDNHTYRLEREILVETPSLSSDWKRTVCAAEALSFVTRQSEDSVSKRLRLMLGSGHGIAALIDQVSYDEQADRKQSDSVTVDGLHRTSDRIAASGYEKRLERARWWQNVILRSFRSIEKGDETLYNHPAILAAVDEIENVCKLKEKVLVFGRFTRPLRALTDLLNAREMLRCINSNQHWPQSKVHENEWAAVLAANKQLRLPKLNRNELNESLNRQYSQLEYRRRIIRENLLENIGEGLDKLEIDSHVRTIYNAFKEEAEKSERCLGTVARAIQDLLGSSDGTPEPERFATTFNDLIDAARDRDEGDENGDGEIDQAEAFKLWKSLEERLVEEYDRPEGGFARLMYGNTKPATRRFLQLAFNRMQSNPRVLVAQSLVGREGLNLHKACRIVILLHPEWNPGVVEQQIGRVDRLGSLWEKKLEYAIEKELYDQLPQIVIRPIIFKGTYDEKNWQVLRERWDDLRAQLHGIVISPRIACKNVDVKIVNELNAQAPNFSPE